MADGWERKGDGGFAENEEYWEFKAEHMKERRNPTTYAGTSKDAIKVRKAVPWDRWEKGTWKKLNLLGLSGKAAEQEMCGIDDEILSNPEILIIQTAGMHEVAKDDIIALADSHDAEWMHITPNNTDPRTKLHGYLRQPAVHQTFPNKLNPTAFLIIVFEKVGQILKPSRAEFGRLITAILRSTLILTNKIAKKEKTAGRRYLKEYLARSRKGSEAMEQLKDARIQTLIEGKRQGDTKVSFDIVTPISKDGEA